MPDQYNITKATRIFWRDLILRIALIGIGVFWLGAAIGAIWLAVRW